MKKSRLPLIVFSMVAALAVGAILVGLISYFVLSADASPTNAQTVPQTNQLDAAPDQIDQTDTAASGQFTVPDSQKPSALDSGQIQVVGGEGSEEHERHESEEQERQEREFGN